MTPECLTVIASAGCVGAALFSITTAVRMHRAAAEARNELLRRLGPEKLAQLEAEWEREFHEEELP